MQSMGTLSAGVVYCRREALRVFARAAAHWHQARRELWQVQDSDLTCWKLISRAIGPPQSSLRARLPIKDSQFGDTSFSTHDHACHRSASTSGASPLCSSAIVMPSEVLVGDQKARLAWFGVASRDGYRGQRL
jgi:hypothetical protein